MRVYNVHDISAAATYIVTKLSAWPKSPRSIINVYAYIQHANDPAGPEAWYVSEGTLQRLRGELFKHEAIVLRTLGFTTHVALPHALCVQYLKTLDVVQEPSGKLLAARAIGHLNAALLSPQLLYLTHQPPALATAAIYLAARECEVKLPEMEWWEVFDVGREELGFLVVGLLSLEGFAKREQERWKGSVPMSAVGLDLEIEKRREEGG